MYDIENLRNLKYNFTECNRYIGNRDVCGKKLQLHNI